MVYLIGAIAVISLTLNFLIYKRIIASYSVGVVEELEPATSHCCCEVVVEYLEASKREKSHDPVSVAKPSEAYQAWTNRKGIPWVPPAKAPEPIVKTPNRGPLARPDGFV